MSCMQADDIKNNVYNPSATVLAPAEDSDQQAFYAESQDDTHLFDHYPVLRTIDVPRTCTTETAADSENVFDAHMALLLRALEALKMHRPPKADVRVSQCLTASACQ